MSGLKASVAAGVNTRTVPGLLQDPFGTRQVWDRPFVLEGKRFADTQGTRTAAVGTA
jgi:hypothetical protein